VADDPPRPVLCLSGLTLVSAGLVDVVAIADQKRVLWRLGQSDDIAFGRLGRLVKSIPKARQDFCKISF
jgi:hypothetical protein